MTLSADEMNQQLDALHKQNSVLVKTVSSLERELSRLHGSSSTLLTSFGKLSNSATDVVFSSNASASAIEKVVAAMGKHGGVLGEATALLGKFSMAVIDTNNAMLMTYRYGITMGNDIGEFSSDIHNAHLTIGEFVKISSEQTDEIARLGGTMDDASQRYLNMVAQYRTTDIAKELTAAGASASDFADDIGLASLAMSGYGSQSKESQNYLIKTAGTLAQNFNEISKITGKSIEQQRERVAEEMRSGSMQAAIAMMNNPAEKQGAESAYASAGVFGKGVQDTLAELMTGPLRTEQGQMQIAALGKAGPALEKWAESVKSGKSPEEIDQRREQFFEQYMTRMNSKDFQWQAAISSNGQYGGRYLNTTADIFQSGAQLKTQMDNIIADHKKQTGDVLTYTQAYQIAAKTAWNNYNQKDAQGNAIKGSEISTTINKVNDFARVLSGDVTTSLKNFNNSLVNLVDTTLPKLSAWIDSHEYPGKPKTPGFSEGTKGVSGSWFGENFGSGTLATLHGREAVVPFNKLADFMNDFKGHLPQNSTSDQLINALTNLTNNFPNQVTDQSPMQTTSPEISQLFIQLNTTMAQMVNQLSMSNSLAERQISVTRKLSNNALA